MARIPWPSVTLVLMFILDLIQGCYQLPIHSDTCDHTIWDSTGQTRGVHSVVAACTEGYVDWKHPYGAIRITFQPSGYVSGPLNLCFIARTTLTVAKISLEEGPTKVDLQTLVTLNWTRTHMHHELCVQATQAVTLYVEAEVDLNSTTVGQVLLEYDVQRASVSQTADPMEDCRPCTESEILTAVCSSDYVVSGQMESVLQNLNGGETEIHVQASAVWRQRQSIFTHPRDRHSANLPTETVQTMSRDTSLQGSIYAPGKCGVHRGSGNFLFMGRIRLGRAILQCAPRLDDFHRMWKKAESQGLNPCTLS